MVTRKAKRSRPKLGVHVPTLVKTAMDLYISRCEENGTPQTITQVVVSALKRFLKERGFGVN